MNYKDYNGTIEELIQEKIKEIEEKNHVKVLHAIESGSRAWGFASPDSDYDVRFIYVRPMEEYLRLDETKDFIDWELDETLDINGWDLSKVLQQFYRSNATLFEWSNSPIVYKTTEQWQRIYEKAKEYFSMKRAMYHYYGTANKNYHAYLTDDMVKYKKYFYVLRPILAYKWIEERKCPPPVLFSDLVESVLEPKMRPAIDQLLEAKVRMVESEKGPKVEAINLYIEKYLTQMKDTLDSMDEGQKKDWEMLNRLFITEIQR